MAPLVPRTLSPDLCLWPRLHFRRPLTQHLRAFTATRPHTHTHEHTNTQTALVTDELIDLAPDELGAPAAANRAGCTRRLMVSPFQTARLGPICALGPDRQTLGEKAGQTLGALATLAGRRSAASQPIGSTNVNVNGARLAGRPDLRAPTQTHAEPCAAQAAPTSSLSLSLSLSGGNFFLPLPIPPC